ncbi:hypothetical protein RJ639_017738 [Escallonia herrerae]|uniref:RNase H type-1 domain-containing protein n=1 Tax=Escallonia herrerae TaxID=1293975 RepID=A0AA88VDL6_9ASTE|nr:hypothetical protein RJ639_017738 [Escallonia herrerae]
MEGDRNTKYFHAKVSVRKRRNLISNNKNSEENWCVNEAEMEATVVAYFQMLFTSSNPNCVDMEEAMAAIETKVTDEMNENLLRNFRDDDVLAALHSMFLTKAPGPDKALAALDGIKLAQQLECQRLCIEGDAADIISALKSKDTNLSKIGHIVDEIKKLVDSFQEVQILHIKRIGNNVAHYFAKEALFVHDMRYWRDVAWILLCPSS